MSYGFWQRLFDGKRNAIGRSIHLNGQPYRVIGVMPRGFAFPNRSVAFWTPLELTPTMWAEPKLLDLEYSMIARLRPDIGIDAARRQLAAYLARIASVSVPLNGKSVLMRDEIEKSGLHIKAQSYHRFLVGDQQSMLLLLQGTVLLVLLIACVNVANLLLSRSLGRTREFAIRSAVGATRATLARQLLVEGFYLAIPGGLGGIALGWLGVQLVNQLGLGAGDRLLSIAPDWRVAGFASVAAALTAVLVSLLPVFHLARLNLHSLLQEGGYSVAGGTRASATREGLVVVELALTAALMTGAGLLLHSFIKLQAVSPGFNTNHVLTARLLAPSARQSKQAQAVFYQDLLARVRRLPSVDHAGLALNAPFQRAYNLIDAVYSIRGREAASGSQPSADQQVVDGVFFETLGIPVLRGRAFDQRDTMKSRHVILVDQLLAKRRFPHQNPIGQQLKVIGVGDGGWYTIIGVVPTIKTQSLAKAVSRETIYLDVNQTPRSGVTLVMRTRTPPSTLITPLRELVQRLDPTVPLFEVSTMHELLGSQLQDRQAAMVLVLVFGGIALLLAMIGVYGVLSYAVSQRTSECGIRLALGAMPRDLLWLFIKEGLRLLALGLANGLALAVALGLLASSQLFQVAPFDPLTLVGTALMMAAVTLFACYLPARRAAQIDPAVAIMK